MLKYVHFELVVDMRISQIISVLNGLLLSTNVVAGLLNPYFELLNPSESQKPKASIVKAIETKRINAL